jgi:hypothetical protein
MTKLRLLVLALAFGLPAAAQDAAKVVFVPAAQIESDIRKAPANSIGESEINLIEHVPEHAAILLRRTAPGQAEVHEFETDVWYVIDGGCVFITGGSMVGGAQTSPGQIRGSSISGGDERRIAKGTSLESRPECPIGSKKSRVRKLFISW